MGNPPLPPTQHRTLRDLQRRADVQDSTAAALLRRAVVIPTYPATERYLTELNPDGISSYAFALSPWVPMVTTNLFVFMYMSVAAGFDSTASAYPQLQWCERPWSAAAFDGEVTNWMADPPGSLSRDIPQESWQGTDEVTSGAVDGVVIHPGINFPISIGGEAYSVHRGNPFPEGLNGGLCRLILRGKTTYGATTPPVLFADVRSAVLIPDGRV